MITPVSWKILLERMGIAPEPLEAALPTLEVEPTPWLMRVLMGMGAWMASCFLIGSITSCIGVIAPESVLLFPAGVLLLGGAALMQRLPHSQMTPFLSQFGLSFFATGVGSLSAFYGDNFEEFTAALLMTLTALPLIVVFHDVVSRFSSTLLLTGSLTWMVSELLGGDHFLEISGLFSVVVLAVTLPMARHPWTAGMQAPMMWAGLAGIYGSISFDLWDRYEKPFVADAAMPWVLGLGLVGLALGLGKTGWVRALGLVGLVLAGFGTPGVLAGLVGVVLAAWRGDKVLLGFTIAFLVVFSSWYYYALDLTLWAKAGTLGVSGGTLLLGRLVILHLARDDKGVTA